MAHARSGRGAQQKQQRKEKTTPDTLICAARSPSVLEKRLKPANPNQRGVQETNGRKGALRSACVEQSGELEESVSLHSLHYFLLKN